MAKPTTIKELTDFLSKQTRSTLFMTALQMSIFKSRQEESIFLNMTHEKIVSAVAKEARKRKLTVAQLQALTPKPQPRILRAPETDETIRRKLHRNVLWRLLTAAWCYDCGEDADPSYMVKHEVWKEAFPEYETVKREANKTKGASVYLCLSCLSKRLRRAITLDDLTDVPLNATYFIGADMGLRKAASLYSSGPVNYDLQQLRQENLARIKGRD